MRNHGKILEDFHRWYFNTARLHRKTLYRGVPVHKSVMDLWSYQEIIHHMGIHWIVETGTDHGGSAYYFADLLDRQGEGRIISVDLNIRKVKSVVTEHPKVVLVVGNSSDPVIVNKVFGIIPENRAPLMLILDSLHTKEHVLSELRAYTPRLRVGDYVIVEDTIVNGHPIRPDFGPGPYEAVEEFLKESPDVLERDPRWDCKFGISFAKGGFFKVK